MKIWRILLVLIIASLSLFVLPVSASPILHEYWNTGGDADSQDIYGGEIVAEQFTSEATSHTVTSIKVELLRVGTPSTVKVSLYNAVAGVPTTEITSVTYAGTILSTSYTMYEFDIVDRSLASSTQYAVVVSCPAGDNANYVQWHQDAGGGLASAVGLHSHDSGISWTSDTPADYLFEIYGEVVFQVIGANVFEDYLTDGDWLITVETIVETINEYPEYTTEDVSRYFNVQLLNVAGTSVIAATTLKSWGNAPCAIYLSPTSVIPLTSGSAYIIRMIGTFAGTPSTNYVLTTEDWIGGNLGYLDQWCLKTAKSMNLYDGNTATIPYTTKSSDGGEVLTTYGGGFFVDSIPSIMDIRPSLFETSTTSPDYEYGTASNTYDESTTYQVQVGTRISTDADIFGNVFGISGKQFLAIGFYVIYIFTILFAFASSDKQGAESVFLMVLCTPIILYANHLRIISIQVTVVACVILAFLFLRKFWLTST
jgi:hypothetical protein